MEAKCVDSWARAKHADRYAAGHRDHAIDLDQRDEVTGDTQEMVAERYSK